jgi:predicted component of type VI protein secretion system
VRAQQQEVLGSDVRPPELQALLGAERTGQPFVFLRDGDGAARIVSLLGDRLVIGRAAGSDLQIGWDARVSGVHAYLERRGTDWMIEDDGLSRHGTLVDGERVQGRRTLRDGDVIQVGDTRVGYRHPASVSPADSGVAADAEAD